MTRLTIICASLLLALATDLPQHKFSKFSPVEAYEVQPGILIMPTYAKSGEVCSVIMQKRHVSSNGIDLDPKMTRDEIHAIFDELAPRGERGRSKLNLGENGALTSIDGPTLVTIAAYENVSLQMYGKNKKEDAGSYVAAVIQWPKRGCGHD